MNDIIDRIDALIDEQLDAGEPLNGFDYGDPNYPRCPHCGRHWHGLPATFGMPCEGSTFIGPIPAPRPTAGVRLPVPDLGLNIPFTIQIDESAAMQWPAAAAQFREAIERGALQFAALGVAFQRVTHSFTEIIEVAGYRLPVTDTQVVPASLVAEKPDLDVEFGPEHWIRSPEDRWAPWSFMHCVRDNWRAITAPDIPTPERPGVDFARFDTFVNDEKPGWTTLTNRSRP